MADSTFNTLCPTCHSRIGEGATLGTAQGELGTDDQGFPVPKWSDDPVLTPDGFSGETFIGKLFPHIKHIQELQDERIQQEADVGVPIEQRTVFSDANFDKRVTGRHIIELRESTEKILNVVGSTLLEYFSLTADEEVATEPGPKDSFKSEWTDAARGRNYIHEDGTASGTFVLPNGVEELSPSMDSNVRIRAIHIEDLRRTLFLGWREFWSVSPIQLFYETPSNFNSELIEEIVDEISGGGGSTNTTNSTNKWLEIRPQKAGTGDAPPNEFEDGFPTNFEIHPTDAGNEFFDKDGDPIFGAQVSADPDIFEIDKLWIPRTFVNEFTVNVVNTTTRFIQPPTGCSSLLVTTTTDQTADGIAEGEIVSASDAAVLLVNANAKTLELRATADATFAQVTDFASGSSGGLNVAVGEPGVAISNIHHIWQYRPDLVSARRLGYQVPPDYDEQGNRLITITKDTQYKFLLDIEVTSEFGRFASDDPDVNQIGLDKRSNNTIEPFSDFQLPGERTPGLRDGVDTATAIEFDSFAFTTSGFPVQASQMSFVGVLPLVPVLFGTYNTVQVACVLVLELEPFGEVFIDLRFNPPPTATESNNFETIDAPFDGQTFTFHRPGTGIGQNRLITVFIDNGDSFSNGSLVTQHDVAININDLLASWKQINTRDKDVLGFSAPIEFDYKSHNAVKVTGENQVSINTAQVQIDNTPLASVTGVFLSSDVDREGTNFFTGGSFDDETGLISLGTLLSDPNTAVIVDYAYEIEDDQDTSGFEVIENPRGTPVKFIRTAFHAGAVAQALKTSEGTPFTTDPFPVCAFNAGTNNGFTDSNIEVVAKVNAIRIENKPGGLI